jgi:hypothetical protein
LLGTGQMAIIPTWAPRLASLFGEQGLLFLLRRVRAAG